MSVIAVDQTFMDRINWGPPDDTKILHGESSPLPLEIIGQLTAALLSEWLSPVILMVYYESHPNPPAKYPADRPRIGFLLTGEIEDNLDKILELLLQEKVLSFYDLIHGGNATMDISPDDNNAQLYQFWISGRGRYANIARSAKALSDNITLYVR